MRKTILLCIAAVATTATSATAAPVSINDGLRAALNPTDYTIRAQV